MFKTFAPFACCVFLLALGFRGVPDDFWQLGERRLPPPAHVSSELRNAVAALPTPDVAAAVASVPASIDEWRREIAAYDEQIVQLVDTVAPQLGVTIRENTIAGVRVYEISPRNYANGDRGRVFVHVHGGAFIKGGGRAATAEGVLLAERLGMDVVSIDYRLAPDHLSPAARDDIVAVWRDILRTHDARRLVLGGTSAGGNLALVATLRLKELGLALPGALFVGTPVADFEKNGDSRCLNEGVDHAIVTWDGSSGAALALYAGNTDPRDPSLSPIYGNFTGFPPTYLVSGTRDLLLSDTVLIHRKLRRANVTADLNIYEGMGHADYLNFYQTPESREMFADLSAFLARCL